MEGDHLFCGWRVRSALPLPELPVWDGQGDTAVDLEVVAGPVPPPQDGEPWLTVTAGGAVRVCVPDVVRMVIEGGRRITVEPLGTEQAAGWRLFLLGVGLAAFCHQRGVLPLHAASLTINGRTLALLGASGAGKSTLAFALARRGHTLLSDDLSVLTSGVTLRPAYPRLKLWRDSLDAMGQPLTGLPRVRDGLDKFDLQPPQTFDTAPRPLDRLVLLKTGDSVTCEAVSPAAAVPLLLSHVSRPSVGRRLGRQGEMFSAAVRLAQQVPMVRLVRPFDFSRMEEVVRLVEAVADGTLPGPAAGD